MSLAVAVCVMTMMLALAASPAWAESEVGSPGTGAGQTSNPRGVDVDEANDLLYVADRGNDRVSVFDASSGTFIKAFGWGVLDGSDELQVCTVACISGKAGSGSGQFNAMQGIAVDNDSGSPGSVYVFDGGNGRVQKFSPAGEFVWMVGGDVNVTTGGDLCTAASGDTCGPGTSGSANGQINAVDGDTIDVGPGGSIYVGDRVVDGGINKTRVQVYAPDGSYVGLLGGKLLEVAGGAGGTLGLAVDSAGNVYVGTAGVTGGVRKYSPAGTELFMVNPSFNVNAVAIGPDGDLFVADNTDVSKILEYDAASGALQRVFYGSLVERPASLAPYPASPLGDIFASEQPSGGNQGRLLALDFPSPGPVVYPDRPELVASPVGSRKATLKARINPEGEATTYHFEYITEADYQAAGESFGAGTLETAEKSLGASDFGLYSVQEQVTGLFPETEYRFRVVATNPSGTNPANPDEGPMGAFNTSNTVVFSEIWSSEVGTEEATLNTEVNPLGTPSTARFQYVEQSEFEATGWANAKEAPAPPADPIDLGEGEEMLDVSAPISGLAEKTAYRYRLVVTNDCKPDPEPLCLFAEPEGTFTTFATLQPITGCPNDTLRKESSGVFLPDCRGYEMVSPVDKNGGEITSVLNISGFPVSLDQAASDGESVTFSSSKAFGDVVSAPYNNQYLSRRSGTGWTSEAIAPKHTGPSLIEFQTAQLDRQYKAFSDDLCSGWLLQDSLPLLDDGAIPDYPGLYRRDNCAPGVGEYEATTRIEPPATAPAHLPARKFIPEFQGASADGTVSIFSVNANLTTDAPAQPVACQTADPNSSQEFCIPRLYSVDSAGGIDYVCVLPGEIPHAGACGAGTPTISSTGRLANVANAISEDGSRIFWSASESGPGKLYVRIGGADTVEVSSSTSARFWSAAADGSSAIYSVGGQLSEFDVDTETATPIAGGFIGFAGASEDASRVYFASTQVLSGSGANSEGEEAVAGQPNLYLHEAGEGATFIGTLDEEDLPSSSHISSPVGELPPSRLSRVSESGEQLAFMSLASITGYDNKDAVNKEANMEVFLYDAAADEILCPSCNPSGARSVGRSYEAVSRGRRGSARLPVYTTQLFAPRVFSEDGDRFYFNSFEALVSRDVNGEEDVYQWRAEGTNGCTAASPTHSQEAGGCLDLISTGQSKYGSELTDVTANGRDVFFKTSESLVAQDPDRLDLYDARINGGFPGPPPPHVICQGEFCPGPPQAAPVAVAPASQAQRPGNPTWPVTKPPKCPKGKHKEKRKGKVVCVKNKKKNKNKNKKGGKATSGKARASLSMGVAR